jgi:hypothetical protein
VWVCGTRSGWGRTDAWQDWIDLLMFQIDNDKERVDVGWLLDYRQGEWMGGVVDEASRYELFVGKVMVGCLHIP